METIKVSEYVIIPLSGRVLIRKDDDKKTTKGGIVLPDSTKIPVITGRVVEISNDVDDDYKIPVRKYDKVLLNPVNAIPVEFEGDNKLFVVPIEDLVAVYRRKDDEILDD